MAHHTHNLCLHHSQARDARSGEMVALKLYHHGRLNRVSSHQVGAHVLMTRPQHVAKLEGCYFRIFWQCKP